ncbi:MAG: hypothetical protein M0Z75_04785 [Nitrospiraceae bacterium]|nr:hypothetical protein [Nitrospiraceae bacterium]
MVMGNFKKKFSPDRLDKAAFAGIIALSASIVVLSVFFRGHTPAGAIAGGYAEGAVQQPLSAEAEARIKQIKNIIEGGGDPAKAEGLIKDAIAQYPYEAEFYMLMGDMYMREQKPLSAVSRYKEAVDLDPDYADKTSNLFEGGKIRVALREAKHKLQAALAKDPDNARLKKAKSDLYYLLRRLAGSCG